MTVRIGLLAASRIAATAVVEPARRTEGVEVVAVAARDPHRARAAAERWGLPRWHGSYEALLADDGVDVVYVATPASLHRPWAVRALAAGRHVLVEKPAASDLDDGRRLAAAADASARVTMVALHSTHHPQVGLLRSLLADGAVGELVGVDARFTLPVGAIGRDDIRWRLELGGGAMPDLGIYALEFLRWLDRGTPLVEHAVADCPVPHVDGRLVAGLRWPDGVPATVTASMVEPPGGDHGPNLLCRGTRGELELTQPVAPHEGGELLLRTASGTRAVPLDPTPTYDHQLRTLRDAVGGGSVVTGVGDALWRLGLLDACYRAAGLPPRPGWPDD